MTELTYKSEAHVKKHIKKLLDEHGWFNWAVGASAYGTNGQSDRLALRDGVLLAIELKYGKNKPTINQKQFLHDVMRNGGLGFCINEKNIWAFEEWLGLFDGSRDQYMKDRTVPNEGMARQLDLIKVMTEMVA